MKFLTISTIKESYYALSPAEQAKIMGPSVQWLLDLKKKYGSKWSIYYTPGMTHQISVGEYASLEEYAQTLMSPSANAGYMEYKTYPLVEMDEKAMLGYIAALSSAK